MRNIYILVIGVLIAMAVLGCSQSSNEGGGDQTSRGQTSVTQGETTVQATTQEETTTGQKTTTASEETTSDQGDAEQQDNAAQQGNDAQDQGGGGQVEITMNAPPGQQNQQPQRQEQQPQQTVTVRITGTEGLAFTGRVGSTQELKRVQGSVPKEYELPFRGAAATAAVRKQEPGQGTLGVEVVWGGEVVASKETSSTPGILNVVWTPQ